MADDVVLVGDMITDFSALGHLRLPGGFGGRANCWDYPPDEGILAHNFLVQTRYLGCKTRVLFVVLREKENLEASSPPASGTVLNGSNLGPLDWFWPRGF